MQQKKFEELFEGYLQNNLSDAEKEQMMSIIQQGEHDNFLKEKIHEMLKSDYVTDVMDKKQSDDILNYILSKPQNEPKVLDLNPKRRRKVIFQSLFVAASIALLIALGNTLFFKQKAIPTITPETPAVVAQNTLIDFSGKQLVHLPDGSTVLLNDNSTLKYDQNAFNSKTREVTLTGEAFFDIKHNQEKPFIVHTGKIQTKVLGTAFNINAKNSSNNIEVTVARGKVQVGDTEKIYGVITPNQQIKVNKSTLSFEQNNVSAAIVTEWKSNYLILDDLNMAEAASLIAQKYKVQILISNDKIKNCRITASFLNEEDLDHVLKVISSVIETEYHYNKAGAVILDGKGCEKE
ncbi:ferric-dicitrate binding protein FerR (iron transport regulator) [Flavobacterium nitrogenifigens]|uniref:Ferric-dicitrate binding protein FerR (Iron transport regulator) n=2 Tax=Flavobacterium TaxID=237 RepID=A0A7W7IW65_9FLAO|nr:MULTISPECIES: FecR domain-containing protein [Flavobacterium]MBB4801637.1 ferric-dicitrate binding protein FerR (iron transport regulator) [Flavobacterium nitrogenifigens]MBB6386595.1 ferric-dicitrate binding protein FerR (iron transport regulator) [Flavobacterium notoginsengisoli]